jgi:O-6-methylguanine DNA methyltransferase
MVVFEADFMTPVGTFYCLFRQDKGKRCSYLGTSRRHFNHYKGHLLKKDREIVFRKGKADVIEEVITSYLNGKSKDASLDFEFLSGTDFQKKVWVSISKIGFGTTVSYRDVAEMVGKPRACRAVGNALGKNPIIISIPCHRIIKSNGDLGNFSSGVSLKRHLLELEGLKFY